MEKSIGMLAAGIVCLLIGGGLTLLSYVNRDPVTGEFVAWVKLLIVGVVFTVFGLIWRSQENQPLM